MSMEARRGSELGPTLEELEALSLNDSPPALGSADGAVVHAGDIGSSAQDPTISEPSVVEETLPLRVVGHAGAMSSGAPDSTLAEPSALEEALTPLSERLRKYEEYLNEHTFDSFEDGIEYLYSVSRTARAEAEAAEDEVLPQQSSLDEYEARSMPAPEQVPSLPARARHSEASMEEIIQNGKKWMSEEVMVAFAKYIEEKDDLKGLEYQFDELRNQCFNVENYYKIFHHFNFTVKMKTPSSTDWTSVLYFTEVKEIFKQKIYFCSPLEPYENGHCYACNNQGMGDLKHPVMGAFDRGNAETVLPFMYESDSDDFLPVRLSDSDDEPW